MKKRRLAFLALCCATGGASAEYQISFVRGDMTASVQYSNYPAVTEVQPINPNVPPTTGLRAVAESFYGVRDQVQASLGAALNRQANALGGTFTPQALSGPMRIALSGSAAGQEAKATITYFDGWLRVPKSFLGGVVTVDCTALISLSGTQTTIRYNPYTLQVDENSSTATTDASYSMVSCESNLHFLPIVGNLIEKIAVDYAIDGLNAALKKVPAQILSGAIGLVNDGLSKVASAYSAWTPIHPGGGAPSVKSYLASNAAYFLNGRALSLQIDEAPRRFENPTWGSPVSSNVYRFRADAFKLDLSDHNSSLTLKLTEERDYRYIWTCSKPVGQQCPIDH
ncbi:hypothetical protein OOZ63_10460 [Paucibacter sp. PLA-PC-4]|uniref:hypothetical protein n=1 Tax=Paucibacter sp. PLA-PC-4 TaxID=2993655 RepID=UPI0022495585|nr:hypothetical protein [Paucibacter sp. PLA-PC-4]MCX2862262.1 hypothetical protein [Paucibacter sp. PLA-PC-4]